MLKKENQSPKKENEKTHPKVVKSSKAKQVKENEAIPTVSEYLTMISGKKKIGSMTREQIKEFLTLVAMGHIKDGLTGMTASVDEKLKAVSQLDKMLVEDQDKGDDNTLVQNESNANKVIMEQIGNSTIDDIVSDCNKEADENANAVTPTND